MPAHAFGVTYICICNTKPYVIIYICICNTEPYVTIYIYVTIYMMCDLFLSSTSVMYDGHLKDEKAYLFFRDFLGNGENMPFVKLLRV